MRIDVHHHFTADAPASLVRVVQALITKVNTVMTTQAELAAGLAELNTTVQKIATESAATLQKVGDLEAALAAAQNISPDVQAAFDALKQQVQAVDDLVPDAPETPVA